MQATSPSNRYRLASFSHFQTARETRFDTLQAAFYKVKYHLPQRIEEQDKSIN